MDHKENEEIMKLVNYIKKINMQIKNPDEEIRKLLVDIQNDYRLESQVIELASANWDNSKITAIDNIDIMTLYNKLPVYKAFCCEELAKKCEKEIYNKIVKDENLD